MKCFFCRWSFLSFSVYKFFNADFLENFPLPQQHLFAPRDDLCEMHNNKWNKHRQRQQQTIIPKSSIAIHCSSRRALHLLRRWEADRCRRRLNKCCWVARAPAFAIMDWDWNWPPPHVVKRRVIFSRLWPPTARLGRLAGFKKSRKCAAPAGLYWI